MGQPAAHSWDPVSETESIENSEYTEKYWYSNVAVQYLSSGGEAAVALGKEYVFLSLREAGQRLERKGSFFCK